jgi:hypothetical protein
MTEVNKEPTSETLRLSFGVLGVIKYTDPETKKHIIT